MRCGGLQPSVTLATNTWTHLACTLDAATTTARLYVDGVERGSGAATVGPATRRGS
ncbi:MAG: LamG-like jellyroll fold domain-containing protein [Kofleriaceae bacterium]|nr:LamG-like jellyroll fold domain-containing protein [Kofleriaceae bacterium]